MPIATWHIDETALPLVATAIHDGHELHPEVATHMTLDKATRLREEDPHSRAFTAVAPNRIVGLRSRFEVDLNRPCEEAVCTEPDDCWDLRVWADGPPPDDVLEHARAEHRAFYSELLSLLRRIDRRHGGFVVLDCHSYNHRRGGACRPPDDPRANPDVNVGTGSLDRARWGGLVDRFIADLTATGLDVRENMRFRGRELARFVHRNWPASGCCLALEFKKTFMDEWTGELDRARLDFLVRSLGKTVPGLMSELRSVIARPSREAAG